MYPTTPIPPLVASFKSQGYPTESFNGLDLDIHNLFFTWLRPSEVLALGSACRSLYVMHHDPSIWDHFMKCIGIPSDLAPCKLNYYAAITIKILEENLYAIPFEQSEIVPLFRAEKINLFDHMDISDQIDFIEKGDSIRQAHGKGNHIYCRDSKYIYVLNAQNKGLIRTISLEKMSVVHIQNGLACLIRNDFSAEIIDLDSSEILGKFQALETKVRRTHSKNECDIQLSDPHVSIGYIHNGIQIWNYRTPAEPICIGTPRSPSTGGHHLNGETVYTAYDNSLQEWNLSSTQSPVKTTSITGPIFSLNTFQNFLCVTHLNDLTVLNTSDLETAFTRQFNTFYRFDEYKHRMNLPLPFGNSILCNIDISGEGSMGIAATKINTLATNNMNMEMVLNSMTYQNVALEREEYYLKTFGAFKKTKILTTMVDGNICILDFSFPTQALSSILKKVSKELNENDFSQIENLYHLLLSPQNKKFLDDFSLAIEGVTFEACLKDVHDELVKRNRLSTSMEENENKLTEDQLAELTSQFSYEKGKALLNIIQVLIKNLNTNRNIIWDQSQ